VGYCERGNEPPGFINSGECHYYLRDSLFLKNNQNVERAAGILRVVQLGKLFFAALVVLISFVSLSFLLGLFLPALCRRRHLITLRDTHTHT